MKLSIDISGARELDEMLKQLPPNIARRAAGNALRAGARVIRDQAKVNAPVGPQATLDGANQPGQLRRSIKVITGKSSQANRRRVLVIVTNKDAGINPHWIEYGTVANRIRKKVVAAPAASAPRSLHAQGRRYEGGRSHGGDWSIVGCRD